MVDKNLVPIERVESKILIIRGQKVIIDSDLAQLYGVQTKRLNEQVRRNKQRFPEDFAFTLTAQEFKNLKSQFAVSSSTWGGKRKLPYAFTEHGSIMAAAVLNSHQAVEMSIFVVRAFIKLRRILLTNAELAKKLTELERKYDSQFRIVFEAIRELMDPPATKNKKQIGYASEMGS